MRIKFGSQVHKYVDIIGKLAHFIQKVAGPWCIRYRLTSINEYGSVYIAMYYTKTIPMLYLQHKCVNLYAINGL